MDLSSPIEDLPKIGPILAQKLNKLEIKTIRDLLTHVPTRYSDYSNVVSISNLAPGTVVTIHASVVSIKNVFSKRGLKMQIGSVEDATGKVSVLWFNQPFLVKTLYPGRLVSLSGKVGFFSRKLSLNSPEYEILDEGDKATVHTGRLVPIYPETAGLSSKWLRTLIQSGLKDASLDLKDPLPSEIRNKFKLIGLKEAFKKVHLPDTEDDAEIGRARLAFDEVLNLQLKGVLRKKEWQKNKSALKFKTNKNSIIRIIEQLPFELTKSQVNSIDEALKDMANNIPMNRLLEGDVGSGKTVVAAIAAFAAFAQGGQTVVMAPTQILATQHYETFKKILMPFNVRVSLITSTVKKIEVGRSDIFIGTHSLINKKIIFDKVSLIVIDEQHRFGVEQRQLLSKKAGAPHILSMTATPIPRTVALTAYGDQDLSVLNEYPKGRQKITTWVIPEQKRDGAYEWIEKQIKTEKSQAFIICPLVEDSESETLTDVKSVTSEFAKLTKIFPKLTLGLLHGRLKSQEKDKILRDFKAKKIDILVATPVVEVGIDIPNATIMMIEAGERFGLAQLHQLRGRVGRGEKKSYCLLFSNFHSGNAFERLKAMEKTHSGFELAELDLKLRGPGEIFGIKQSGFPELKIASWNDFALIKATKELAQEIINFPKNYPRVLKTLI